MKVVSVIVALLFVIGALFHAAATERQRDEHAALQALAESRGWYRGSVERLEPTPMALAEPLTGRLAATQKETIELASTGVREGLVLASCDDACGDIDLRLIDGEGRIVGFDEEPDALPIVSFSAGDKRSFSLEVTMSECASSSCAYAFQEFQYESDESAGGTGTCFAVSPDGLLMTAWHVVEGGTELIATFPSGFSRRATLVSASRANDVALLKIPDWRGDWLPFARPDSTTVGQPAFSVGYPNPEILNHDPKLTEGYISALSGYKGEFAELQMQVPIQPGSSGAPLVSHDGVVLGVVTSTAEKSGDGSPMQLVNYAARSDFAALLLPPEVRLSAMPTRLSREAAIRRALAATCRLDVS